MTFNLDYEVLIYMNTKMLSIPVLAVATAGFMNQGFAFTDGELNTSGLKVIRFSKLPTQEKLDAYLKDQLGEVKGIALVFPELRH